MFFYIYPADYKPTSTSDDFIIREHTLEKYTGASSGFIKIPEVIITIANSAFENTNIKNVWIPEEILRIGERAFANCQFLEHIHLPDSLVWLGKEAFYAAQRLRTIYIPPRVGELNHRVLAYCSSLRKIKAPAGLVLEEDASLSLQYAIVKMQKSQSNTLSRSGRH